MSAYLNALREEGTREEIIAALGKAMRQRDELLAALEAMLDEHADDVAYCELCEAHAPKRDDGTICGRVTHRPNCSTGMARAAIAKVAGEK